MYGINLENIDYWIFYYKIFGWSTIYAKNTILEKKNYKKMNNAFLSLQKIFLESKKI